MNEFVSNLGKFIRESWIVLVIWAGMLVYVLGRKIWLKRKQAQMLAWAMGQGKVEGVGVDAKGRRGGRVHVAELYYRYSVGDETFRGSYKREFKDEEEAWSLVERLKDMPIPVRYDPNERSHSGLRDEEVDLALACAPPLATLPESELQAGGEYALGKIRFVLIPFLGLSAVGLITSVFLHVNTFLANPILLTNFQFFSMHIGIFVVFFPGLIAISRVGKGGKRNATFKNLLRNFPPWVGWLSKGVAGYLVINFVIFMVMSPSGTKAMNIEGGPLPIVVRGFSGHWIAFYGASFAMLWAGITAKEVVLRCPQGHEVTPFARYCAKCGAAVS